VSLVVVDYTTLPLLLSLSSLLLLVYPSLPLLVVVD
jgi:hypothetical protein